MTVFHWMRLRAFSYATEEREKVMKAVDCIAGGETVSQLAEGAYGDTIEIIERSVRKERGIAYLLSRLSKMDLRKLVDEADERTDERSVFHFRLDKQRACEGECVLTGGGDVIDVEIKIASYPASKEGSVRVIKRYLEALM